MIERQAIYTEQDFCLSTDATAHYDYDGVFIAVHRGYIIHILLQKIGAFIMTCRDEILAVVNKIINEKGINEFTILEVLDCMRVNGTQFAESTIRTHITSRLCVNAPDNHEITYDDFERIDTGVYKLL